jgi:hypothetical protein
LKHLHIEVGEKSVFEQCLKKYLFTIGENGCSCDFAAVDLSEKVAQLPFKRTVVQE